MKHPKSKFNFDPLTLGAMITSPEYRRWAFGVSPSAAVFSPKAVARVIDAHANTEMDALRELQRARNAAGLAHWHEARQAIRKAFAIMSDPVRNRDGLLNFLEHAEQAAKSANKLLRNQRKGRT